MTRSINNIVFDLGAVLLHWQPREIAQAFTPDPLLQDSLLDNIFYHDEWQRLDAGVIDEQQAIEHFARNTGLDTGEVARLMLLVKQSLMPKQDSVELLTMLKDQHRVYCLSNICNEIFEFVSQRHDFFNLFEDTVISAQVKMIKPDPAIFRYMLDRFKAEPRNTLFIDDMPANIAAAQSLGIRGIQFENASLCKAAINNIIR